MEYRIKCGTPILSGKVVSAGPTYDGNHVYDILTVNHNYESYEFITQEMIIEMAEVLGPTIDELTKL